MIRLIADGTANVNRATVENMVVNQHPSVHTFLPEAKHPSNQKVVISTGPGRPSNVVILIPSINYPEHQDIFWIPHGFRDVQNL